MSQDTTVKLLEDYKLTLCNGLLTIEGGVAMSGVSIDMVKNLREVFMCLSTLVNSLEGKEALQDPEIEVEYSKARCLMAYLRKTRDPLISGMSAQTKGSH
jgi:hypothetical protein